MEYLTHSPEETEALGKKLAARLKPGDFVALYGNLGVGKTAFVRGLASVLCPGVRVQSPTYTIVNAYRGTVPLYHFDLYRIEGEESLYSCGFFDYLISGGICVAEWCEKIEGFVPEEAITVRIEKTFASPEDRKVVISCD